ncbi:MAG: hypothetical protein ACOH2J_16605 [Allorhizobium sp.]
MWRFEFAVVADLTANVFATCFLLFLVGWHSGAFGSNATLPSLEDTYRVEDVTTLSGAQRVQMLHRRANENVLRLDLLDEYALVLVPGKEAVRVDADQVADALSAVSGQAELYIFSNVLYYPVTSTLAARNIAWREIDVPQALRALPSALQGWSSGFLVLIEQKPGAIAFSAGLARLLEAASSDRARQAASAASSQMTQISVLQRLGGLVHMWLTWAALVAGAGLVVFTEWRYPPESLE